MLSRADCIGLVLRFLALASWWRCALVVLRSVQSLGSACQTQNCSEALPGFMNMQTPRVMLPDTQHATSAASWRELPLSAFLGFISCSLKLKSC